MSRSCANIVAVAGLFVAAVAGAQWREPYWSQSKGEGALVVRDGAPGYESKSSTKVKRTFQRGEAVAGFHAEFLTVSYELLEINGRVRVLYLKPDSALVDVAWMDFDDLLPFIYDCCDPDCIPYSLSLKRSAWNPCFKEGIAKVKGQLEALKPAEEEDREDPRAARSPAGAKEKPLTNEAVLAMLQAELGDELVIAKIRQAPAEELDVSPEALVKLRKQGVSKAVLDAMVKRAGSR